MIDQIMHVLGTLLILFAMFLLAAGISKLVDMGSDDVDHGGWNE